MLDFEMEDLASLLGLGIEKKSINRLEKMMN